MRTLEGVRERASVEKRFQKTPVGSATGDRKRGWGRERDREREREREREKFY